MAAKLGNQALVYSADSKNKIRVGDDTLAVDRRIDIIRFFPVNDSPLQPIWITTFLFPDTP